MRWPFFLIPLPVAACSSLPSVPAPWEPTETQLSEPTQSSSAAAPAWTRIGSSVRGKPIEAVTLGSGPKRVYIIGGIHGDEPEGPATAGPLPAALLPDSISETGERCTIRIVRDVNPDGTGTGTRANTRGIDLNRNWPSHDYRAESVPGSSAGRRPASELEVIAVKADLDAFKPDVVIIFHTAPTGRGPEVGFMGRSATLAYDFTDAARATDGHWRVDPHKGHIAPGSLESLVGNDMGKPVLLIGLKRGSDAEANAKSIRTGLVALASSGAPPKAAKAAENPAAPIKAPILGGH